jgi:cupin fold WbuC family metalloprotein
MILKRNKKSKSLSYTLIGKENSINLDKIYNFLKKKNKIISRVCLHRNHNSGLHQMLIFQKKNYKSDTKFHPQKEKSYNLIKGKQKIYIYKKNGNLQKIINLDGKNNFLFMKKNITHSNKTVSEDSFHIETIKGPFNNRDRIYINENK